MNMWRTAICTIAATVSGLMVLPGVRAETFPYSNDFSASGLTNSAAQFTLDTDAGVLKYAAGPGTVVSTTSSSISGIGTSNFVVSTRFVLNNVAGTGNLATIGFGALSSAPDFITSTGNSFYLADWGITNATAGSWGQLRILGQGHSLDAGAVNGDSDGAGANGSSVVNGNTYELRLTGALSGSTLGLTLALFDGSGGQLGTSATATDSVPLTGEFFGLRNRTAGANHMVDINYDRFSVGAPPQGTPGDYNGNGVVDGADYVVWRKHLDTAFALTNEEANTTPGQVTQEDYGAWRSHFGQGTPTGASFNATVPEPSLLTFLASAATFTLISRRSPLRSRRLLCLHRLS
jgi:hypothetical protein